MEKCIVKGCQNHRHQGAFVGDLCKPCHVMLTEGKELPSTALFATEARRAQHAQVVSAIEDYLSAWRRLPKISGYTKPTFDVWLERQLVA